MKSVEKNVNTVRVVVIDISKPLSSEVYDEVIIPLSQATNFAKKYIDITKYRIITI